MYASSLLKDKLLEEHLSQKRKREEDEANAVLVEEAIERVSEAATEYERGTQVYPININHIIVSVEVPTSAISNHDS